MSFELTPQTPAGEAVAAAAQNLVPGFRKRAAAADRAGDMCRENFTELQSSRLAAAFVPEVLGGFGLDSVHDWLLLINTLARGDGSTAIAINMHLGFSRGLAIAYNDALRKNRPTDATEAPLRAIVDGKMLVCATATERGTDNLHPLTTATATDSGWEINGQKIFVTMSPIATHLAMNLRTTDDAGDRISSTLLPINTPGLKTQGDWDALGMRASGSQSVKFENVQVASHAVRPMGTWGQWTTASLISRTLGNLALVAAFLGIAEHARDLAIAALGKQKRRGEAVADSPGVQQMVGEMEIELEACRSILQVAGMRTDDWLAGSHESPPSIEDAHQLMKDYQTAKWTVNRGAIDIVNRAMDLVGGGGFMSNNALTQLYRDVRAGPFMQPLGATELRGYVGQVALGIYPER